MKKILIVDDEEMLRTFSQRALDAQRYETQTAENGREALEKLAESKPNLILTDLNMPEMDGFELCRMVKGDDRYQDIPIIAYSGLDNEEKAREAGADAYIQKPFNVDELYQKIDQLLEEN